VNAPEKLAGSVSYDMPAEQYHAINALGSGDVQRILRSPAHYQAGPGASTDARDLGTAIHTAVLEPHLIDATVAVSPKFDRRTTAGKAAAAAFDAEHAGRLILEQADFDTVLRVRDAVHAHAGARTLLAQGAREVTLQWADPDTGCPAKARLDWLRPDGGCVDLKSTRDASPAAFRRAIANYGYHVQAAHYDHGSQHVLGAPFPYWIWIAVEKEPPYGVGVYVLDRNDIDRTQPRVRAAYERWAQCNESGVWPAYSSLIEPITLPEWA
jgi:hypothetical protein